MKLKVLSLLGIALVMLASYTNDKKVELSEVRFYDGSYDELLRESKKQKKPIILEFWANWCIPCRKMQNETFANPEFASYINRNFLVYKVNIDTFDGMDIADKYNIDAYPTLVLLDSKNKYINRYKGFFPAYYLKKRSEER